MIGTVAFLLLMISLVLSKFGESLSIVTTVGLVTVMRCSPVMRTQGLSLWAGFSTRSSAVPPSEGDLMRTESPTMGRTSETDFFEKMSFQRFAGEAAM